MQFHSMELNLASGQLDNLSNICGIMWHCGSNIFVTYSSTSAADMDYSSSSRSRKSRTSSSSSRSRKARTSSSSSRSRSPRAKQKAFLTRSTAGSAVFGFSDSRNFETCLPHFILSPLLVVFYVLHFTKSLCNCTIRSFQFLLEFSAFCRNMFLLTEVFQWCSKVQAISAAWAAVGF